VIHFHDFGAKIMRPTAHFLQLGCASALLIACSDSTSPRPSGTLRFTYSGAATGTFVATGPRSVDDPPKTGAGGRRTGNTVEISAQQMTGTASADFTSLELTIYNVAGSAQATPCTAEMPAGTTCIPFAHFYSMETGIVYIAGLTGNPGTLTVAITNVSATRIAGTFEGFAPYCPQSCPPGTGIVITGGMFDIPLQK
jgi:hypothetical protein